MVNQKRLLEIFQILVSFDAESYEEREIADYLKEKLVSLGLQVEEDNAGELLQKISGKDGLRSAGNIYGFLPGNLKNGKMGNGVLLSSHMDTVKPGKGKKVVFHDDGRITSDGTTVLGADDAAGLAEILEALHIIQEQKLPHPDIEVLFPAAEEPYAQGSRIFDYSKIKAKQAYVFDLSGEVGRAAIAAPSMLSMRIQVNGKSAHAGFCPEEGVHAISIAARAIAEIPNGHTSEDTTVNLGTIQGGIARNIVPDSCVITGEIRSMSHEQALKQAQRIKTIFEQQAERGGGSAEIEITEEFKAYRIEADEPVVQRFVQACKELRLSGELEETFGGSDNNHFAAHGIRGIVVANAMNEVHTTKEYTSVDELICGAELALKLAVAE